MKATKPARQGTVASAFAVIAFAFLGLSSAGLAAADSATGPDASASIVNGKATSIRDWPWQVSIVESRRLNPKRYVRQRQLCGGAMLTPRLVITAAHCVEYLGKREVRQLQIVSGRTRLNAEAGQIVPVTGRRMPVDESGQRRYDRLTGVWDVALLTVGRPLAVTPIKLAGPDEDEVWAPGSKSTATGWGLTRMVNRVAAFHLRKAGQVMLGDGVCTRWFGKRDFRSTTMTCVGGPGGHASTCYGDSGGPLVVKTSDGYRLVGLTSWGVTNCKGTRPSVFTRVAGKPIRDWVRKAARGLTGSDVVGSGAAPLLGPAWCQVPALKGLTAKQAKGKIKAAGCRPGNVLPDRRSSARPGRVTSASRLPGWYSRLGTSIHIWVRR